MNPHTGGLGWYLHPVKGSEGGTGAEIDAVPAIATAEDGADPSGNVHSGAPVPAL